MISSYNEWSPLKKIVVGSASHANWPVNDLVFAKESEKTTWKESPVPRGPVLQRIIDEANEDLDSLATTLMSLGVEVVRPDPLNFQVHDGLYNYCPRDRLLVHGSKVIDIFEHLLQTRVDLYCPWNRSTMTLSFLIRCLVQASRLAISSGLPSESVIST